MSIWNESKESLEMRKKIEAAAQRLYSPEAIASATEEFAMRMNGWQPNAFESAEIAKALGDLPPTADNLIKAAETRLAVDMTQDQLKAFINSRA